MRHRWLRQLPGLLALTLTAAGAVFSWRTHCWRNWPVEQLAKDFDDEHSGIVCRVYPVDAALDGIERERRPPKVPLLLPLDPRPPLRSRHEVEDALVDRISQEAKVYWRAGGGWYQGAWCANGFLFLVAAPQHHLTVVRQLRAYQEAATALKKEAAP